MINSPDRSTVLGDIFISGFRKISEPCTVASAEGDNPALPACIRKICFERSEPGSQRTFHNGPDVVFYQISELPFSEDEKIAGVTVPVMFDHQIAAAGVVVAA